MTRFLACWVTLRSRDGLWRRRDGPVGCEDEEQDVEGLQPDRLHGEEVGGEDAVCLGPQELRPGGALAPRSRTESVSTKPSF